MASSRPSAFEDTVPTWRGALVRQLATDQAKRLDEQIVDARARREGISKELGELTMRRELLERITSLSDSMLERLVLELGDVVPGARHAGAECPGCDRRGLDIRQETNGDLVCQRCGRKVSTPAPDQDPT